LGSAHLFSLNIYLFLQITTSATAITTAITNDLDHHTIKVFAIAGGLEAEESLAQQAYNSLHRLVSERSHTLNLSLCTRNQKNGTFV
jgi:hypothetical protein